MTEFPLAAEWAARAKFRAEGAKLQADADVTWLLACIVSYGNIAGGWDNDGACVVDGDRYEPADEAGQ
ncbi:MAG: hypothetical protein GY767_17790 [Shimia sp.]|nr:hypothetical protein [Shimia sp.]